MIGIAMETWRQIVNIGPTKVKLCLFFRNEVNNRKKKKKLDYIRIRKTIGQRAVNKTVADWREKVRGIRGYYLKVKVELIG